MMMLIMMIMVVVVVGVISPPPHHSHLYVMRKRGFEQFWLLLWPSWFHACQKGSRDHQLSTSRLKVRSCRPRLIPRLCNECTVRRLGRPRTEVWSLPQPEFC